MSKIEPRGALNQERRRFLSTAAVTIATANLGSIGSATAQPGRKKPAAIPPVKPGANTSLGSVRQIDAGVLNIGYAESRTWRWSRGHPAARLAIRHS